MCVCQLGLLASDLKDREDLKADLAKIEDCRKRLGKVVKGRMWERRVRYNIKQHIYLNRRWLYADALQKNMDLENLLKQQLHINLEISREMVALERKVWSHSEPAHIKYRL